MNNIDNYYLGFIQLDPTVYNRDTARRMIDDVNYDPFCEESEIVGMIQGKVILLRKEGDIFYDEYSSRYKNEIKLKLGKTEKHGIRLTHVKKFTDVYKKKPQILVKEDVENDCSLLYDLLFEHEYYISYSKLDKTYVPVIINEEKMLDVREEYFDIFFRQPYQNKGTQKK